MRGTAGRPRAWAPQSDPWSAVSAADRAAAGGVPARQDSRVQERRLERVLADDAVHMLRHALRLLEGGE